MLGAINTGRGFFLAISTTLLDNGVCTGGPTVMRLVLLLKQILK